MSNLYCMACKEFVAERDKHDCPSKYIAAIDKEMAGIAGKLFDMGITPMIAVWSATELGETKGYEYLLTMKIDIGRKINKVVLGDLPAGWKYHWEMLSPDGMGLHMIVYVEHWYNMGPETLYDRICKKIKELEEYLDTLDIEGIKALLLLADD